MPRSQRKVPKLLVLTTLMEIIEKMRAWVKREGWAWRAAVLVISGKFGEGVAGSTPYITKKTSVHLDWATEMLPAAASPALPLEVWKNLASYCNVSGDSDKQKCGLGVELDGEHQLRGSALVSGPWCVHPLFTSICLSLKRPIISEKAMNC